VVGIVVVAVVVVVIVVVVMVVVAMSKVAEGSASQIGERGFCIIRGVVVGVVVGDVAGVEVGVPGVRGEFGVVPDLGDNPGEVVGETTVLCAFTLLSFVDVLYPRNS